MGTPTCITVHHEGDYASPMSQSYVCGHLRAIRTQQVKDKASGGLGAGDIAYHFIIEPSGSVWEGRSLQYQGAHAGNALANHGNIGICLLGNFDTQPVPEAQKRALRSLLVTLMKRYNIPPSAVYTHREVKQHFGLPATDCPGRNLQAFMDGLRSELRVASR
jgi:N-acetyl-anhydromuramyl-L-alanine amidase AmpD